jgi:cytochrome c oxidase accessory protein FixG
LVIFFTLPFLRWKGEPLFLFHVLERKFILFGVRFWPQDFFIFMIGMIAFIVFIALFTVVFGRVFCGWVCPQTVFMEMIFRKIEYWIEGDSSHQRALNKMPWTATKIRKKGLKYSLFFFLSVVVANTFLAYIIGLDALKRIVTDPLGQHIGGFALMLIFSAVFFFVFSWFREQACLVVCPYGRMQGVLLDRQSIVVAYDHVRGEPRSKFHKDQREGEGDCIDCSECVRVCPTGIDIRHGTQLECTNCTACMDACDAIMKHVNKPKGLVRYASEATIADGARLKWTPRMVAYTVVLIALIGLESFLLVSRKDLDVNVVRAKGTLFYREEDGRISNLYNVKIINKTHDSLPTRFAVSGFNAEVRIVGSQHLVVPPDTMMETQVFVVMDPTKLGAQKSKIGIEVWSNDVRMSREKTTFLAPLNQH